MKQDKMNQLNSQYCQLIGLVLHSSELHTSLIMFTAVTQYCNILSIKKLKSWDFKGLRDKEMFTI